MQHVQVAHRLNQVQIGMQLNWGSALFQLREHVPRARVNRKDDRQGELTKGSQNTDHIFPDISICRPMDGCEIVVVWQQVEA